MQKKLVKSIFWGWLIPCGLFAGMSMSSGVSSSTYMGKTQFKYINTDQETPKIASFTTHNKILQPDHCYRYALTAGLFGLEGEWLKSQIIYDFSDFENTECTQKIRYLFCNFLTVTSMGVIRFGLGRAMSSMEGEFPKFSYNHRFSVPAISVGVEARYSTGGGFFCFVDTKWTFFQAATEGNDISLEMSSIVKHTIAGIGCQF